MTIYINRHEAECLLDALTGQLTAAQNLVRNDLISQLLDRLGKSEVKTSGWTPGIVNGRVAPLRSSWPQNITKPARKNYVRKPSTKKPKSETAKASAKPTMSPQQILEELGL